MESSSSTDCYMEKPVDPSNRLINLTDVSEDLHNKKQEASSENAMS